METKTRRHWLRERGSSAESKVSFLELFFDLVFVFSVSQLAHTLAAHFTFLGAIEAALLVFAIWWVWIFTAWVTNWLDPEKMPVRFMLLVLMLAALIMSASIPEAYAEKGLIFAGAYVFMQVGRSLFTLFALKKANQSSHLTFVRISCWLIVSGVFWIAGGLAEHETRILLWAIAVAIEYAGPAAGFWVPSIGRSSAADWDISGAHLAERSALFIIICLGETIIVSGRTFAELPVSSLTSVVFAISFIGSVAMWWLYFHAGHERAAQRIEHAQTPGSLGRQAFTYAHLPILAGIILNAVADEFTFSHPHNPVDPAAAIAILGGPALFLAGNLWFKGATSPRPPLSHFLGLLLFVLLAFLIPVLELYQLAFLATAALLVVALWEYVSLRRTTDVIVES
ncbi:low temperature requirement protein A [Rhizobium sp. BK251]|uniref:low temperature requirement protein A n=1 Tax=Rhizobium sp. BK251 TaxID=2512125 RepID=UPI0010434960|nr:low temperature requirement protein A [Rhizobium sp. BK251]